MAFIGPIPRDQEVNHKDANKANNRHSNLEYLTRTENIRHGFRSPTAPKGARHHKAKNTEADIRQIRRQCAAGEAQSVVAASYGLSRSTVSGIVHRRTWKHVR